MILVNFQHKHDNLHVTITFDIQKDYTYSSTMLQLLEPVFYDHPWVPMFLVVNNR